MGKPTGFLEYKREVFQYRPIDERVRDWKEGSLFLSEDRLQTQAARCMDCGVPFCHTGGAKYGCPLGNLIPEWNDLVYRGHWRDAIERLHATNNFPEITGRACPAPCEASCCLGITSPAVTIKNIELTIAEKAWEMGWIKPRPATVFTKKKVAVVGSGPAGLACAQQLARVGHSVTVFERDDRIGGLLTYGIPQFKIEKYHIFRRVGQLQAEGVKFVTNAHVGVNVPAKDLVKKFDAVVLCGGATLPRDLKVPGRPLKGVHFAMEYLAQANRAALGEYVPDQISAKGKNVLIIGGGDTGADCLGTATRQGARSIRQWEILPRPPEKRAADNPWPEWPRIWRSSTAHDECECREWAVSVKKLTGRNGQVAKGHAVRVEWKFPSNGGAPKMKEIPRSGFTADADLVLLAMGYLGPERSGVLKDLGIRVTDRGSVASDPDMMTSTEGVFSAGDMRRGQSLIVWAIAEGRQAARGVDRYLMGETSLPQGVVL